MKKRLFALIACLLVNHAVTTPAGASSLADGHRLPVESTPASSVAAAMNARPDAAAQAGDLLLQNGYVMTMDPATGDMARADILIRGDRIVAIAPDIDPGPAQRIEVTGKVVLPGFVDTHSHLYVTTMRGQFRNAQGKFFPVSAGLAAGMTPQDTHIAMYTGALELLASGITTTGDFFDNVLTPAHATAGLQALERSGIRGIMFYGGPDKTTRKPIDMDHLGAMVKARAALPAPRIALGLAWRLPRALDSTENWAMRDHEYQTARALGVPIQVHVSGQPAPMFNALLQRGLLYPGMTVVHATDASPAQLAALQAAGAALSLTPISEHRVGFGLTRLDHFEAVSRQGLGIDGNALAGSADMFATLRLAALTWSGGKNDESAPDPRALLELATRRGAESMGMGRDVGTLAPGKKADIQIVDLQAINLSGFGGGDPAALLVYSATRENVSDVIVDGRLVKRDHLLVDVDMAAVLEQAQSSARALVQRADSSAKNP